MVPGCAKYAKSASWAAVQFLEAGLYEAHPDVPTANCTFVGISARYPFPAKGETAANKTRCIRNI